MTETIVLVFFRILFPVYALFQLGRVHIGSVTLYLYEPILFLHLLFFLIFFIRRPFKKIRSAQRFTLWFILILLITFAISASQYTYDENITAVLYAVRLIIHLLWFLYVSYILNRYARLIPLMNRILMGLIIWVLFTGFLQYFWYPDLRNIIYQGWDPHLNRLVGLYLEPPIAACSMGLLFLHLIFQKKLRGKSVLLGFLALSIFLTYSRGAYLASVLTGFFLILIKRIHLNRPLENDSFQKTHTGISLKIIVPFLIALGIIMLFFIPQEGEGMNLLRSSTVYARFDNYAEALELISRHPLFGIGYNHIPFERSITPLFGYPDHALSAFQSSFLTVFVTMGLFGLFVFVKMLYEWGKTSEFAPYALLFTGVASLTDNVLLHPFILFLLCSLLALHARGNHSRKFGHVS